MSNEKILIVEDQAGFRKVYSDVLQDNGYNVLTADDGEKGLDIAKQEKPDLVLLDMVLPKLQGMDVLKGIRANTDTKDTPVIILSVLGDKQHIQEALEAGANDYTVKGFYTPREILNKIKALLTESSAHRSIAKYRLSIDDSHGDALKLQQDIGLTKMFQCPQCNIKMALELIPDYSRTDGHWFSAHFICPECKREF